MRKQRYYYYWLLGWLLIFPQLSPAQVNIIKPTPDADTSVCPIPVLSRLKPHKIIAGETVASIAQQYNLIPETLIQLNPILKNGTVPVGKEILIPPFNGIRVQVPQGATWQDLEGAYGIRADILFELNGCQKLPKVVFVPGTNWTTSNTPKKDYTGLRGYPLPSVAKVGLGYGWQGSPTQQQRLFHSGIDLLADVGTFVLAADDGEVAFVGQEGAYGILIVINHPNNRQTRYAHLGKVTVKIGQMVKSGDVIGTVGTTGKPDITLPHLHFEVRFKTPLGWTAQDPIIHLQI